MSHSLAGVEKLTVMQEALRKLPSIDQLMRGERCQGLIQHYGRSTVKDALRTVLAEMRSAILAGDAALIDEDGCLNQAESLLQDQFAATLLPVINATGVILHTNLGRAPLSLSARAAVAAVSQGYSSLELDLGSGKRGSRHLHAAKQLSTLTGAEDALVVNNNAAALVLMLTALAKDQEVIISRGQLVEIGGGFRIPEIMADSGAILREIGSTNRTRRVDYERALTPKTAMLLRVHPSNFRQSGFVESATLAEMVRLAADRGIWVADDVGSGALLDTRSFGLPEEPTVQDGIQAGADIVLFSGDKLLGGPQAGILVGKKDVLGKIKNHPLARALRADKLTLAALCATLDSYLRGQAMQEIPIWWMITREVQELKATAQRWQKEIGGEIVETESTVGGGSLPGGTLPSVALSIATQRVDSLASELRKAHPPIIARIESDRLLLDPRTVLPEQEEILLANAKGALT